MKDKAQLRGETYVIKEFVNPDKEEFTPFECTYETEKVYIISAEDAKRYMEADEIHTVKSETYKNLTQGSQFGVNDSPEIYRRKARLRILSNSKKYPKFMGEEVEISQERSLTESQTKKKKMMIAHTDSEAYAQNDQQYVDPNSMEYQTLVMENMINRHQREKTRVKGNLFSIEEHKSSIIRVDKKYEGEFSVKKIEADVGSRKSSQSPTRVNDPLWESRKKP